MNDRNGYDVVWPLAKRAQNPPVAMNARLSDASPRRFGFIWDYVFRGDHMFPLIQAGLAEKYPGSEFVPYETFGNIHGHNEHEVLAALPQRLRSQRVDAVIVGVGA